MLSDKKINIDVCVRALQSPISAEVSIISPRNGSTAKELDDDGESLLHGYVNLKKAARAITAGQICASLIVLRYVTRHHNNSNKAIYSFIVDQ